MQLTVSAYKMCAFYTCNLSKVHHSSVSHVQNAHTDYNNNYNLYSHTIVCEAVVEANKPQELVN